MDFDEYVAARYGRLIEHAVLLGCAEGEAGTYVDRVLLEQRKAIRRAEDPDPLVHDALERAIGGTPERRSRTGPFVALGVVAAAVAVAVVLTYRPAPEPMPSLFSFTDVQARELLEGKGYDVLLRPVTACEPRGLVIGSDPKAGELVPNGGTVTLRTAEPSELLCGGRYDYRSDAWEFVTFALGGAAPDFADSVLVLVDQDAPVTLTQEEARQADRWETVFEQVTDAAQRAAPTQSGMPTLLAAPQVPPADWCGVPRPLAVGTRFALRIEIDPRAPDDDIGCPLTIDLYRVDGVIDEVVVYSPQGV